MKPSLLSRIIGVLLIVAAVGGLIFSIFGVVTIWRYKSTATQGLLNSVDLLQNTLQTSAQVIDGVLKTISSLPIIGSGVNYNPQTSLADSLGQISDSLDGLPNSFVDMGEGLQDTTHNLQIMQVDFALMVDAVRQIEVSVAQYKEVVAGYQESIKQVQAQLDLLAKNVPAAVNAAAWALTIFLVWMAIAQIGLFTQGLQRLSPRPKAE